VRATKPVTFLLVEDDEVDIQAVRRAFARLRLANDLIVAHDGVAALELLRGSAGEPLPRPYIVLLDLNMPRMGGLEFLETLRADAGLTDAVVFVMTTSAEERDRVAAYRSHVAGYIVKGDLSSDGLLAAIDMLDRYWRVVELP
jgi:CheY-like chemotaxis protein